MRRMTGPAGVSRLRRRLLRGTAAGSALAAAGLACSREAAADPAAAAQTGHPGRARPPSAEDRPFWFGFIGDTPYSRRKSMLT